MKITVYSAAQQGTGVFDGGKITEQKPIAFPHEKTAVKRVGTLFYWAWGFSNGGGLVPMHPHQAFEIMSYVINGNMAHKDTLGTKSVVGPGGVQVMQTGTGVYHEEESFGSEVEGFQIWFEPNLQETVKMKPTYRQFEHEDFPISEREGNVVKTIIGQGSALTLQADAKMWDVFHEQRSEHRHVIPAGYSLAVLAIRGNGSMMDSRTGQVRPLAHKDFVVIDAESQSEVVFQSDEKGMRLIIIQVPTVVDYPLYRK